MAATTTDKRAIPRTAGASPSQLTDGDSFEQNPAFSADAKKLPFSSDWFSAEEKLTTMDMGSKKAQPLIHDTDRPDSPALQRTPVWSRDGRTISFVQGTGGYLNSNVTIQLFF